MSSDALICRSDKIFNTVRGDNMLLLSALKEEVVETDDLDLLLLGVSKNDSQALEKLYIKTKGAVYGLALSILKDTHQAEDVLQDVYIKIMSAAHLYDSSGKPMAWIMTITRNLALMKIRQSKRFCDMPEHYEASVESHEVHFENKSVLNAAMNCLSSQESSIVVMHCVSGLKHREIADILSLPLSTVLSKYNRALKKLRAQLKEA